jgi:hypothetical protein
MPSAAVEKAARAVVAVVEKVVVVAEVERVAAVGVGAVERVAVEEVEEGVAEGVEGVEGVVDAEPVAAVLDADSYMRDMGVSHAISIIRRHTHVRFRDLPQNMANQKRRFQMSSYKKYIGMGVSLILIPLVKSLVSKMINRYTEKTETDASDGKSETFTRRAREEAA